MSASTPAPAPAHAHTHAEPASVLSRLLSSNAQWAQDVAHAEHNFFEECAKGQHPKVLWIGCADSRVPESVVLACKPGEVFVHRNIANQVHPHDENVLSVLTYAVAHLGVEHVVVVGHTNCGGVAACLAAAAAPPAAHPSPLDRWLAPLTALAAALGAPAPDELVAANVRAQVQHVLESDVVQAAWSADPARKGEARLVGVHGWVYELESGRVRDLEVSQYAPQQQA